ncbi:hypothetical protein [Bacillus thuringiensis]|uniref:hypothetical protein n=1 Tax=Bacillus thuringiensis TaxID=1428 RepID=UPI00159C883C|nr:hypothetical protein [Bacillus thuringiensis]
MKISNGYKIYEEGEEAEPIPGMPRIPEYMYSRYGWKIKKINGKKYWTAMNEEEYRIEVSNALGIKPSEVTLDCGTPGDTGCHRDCYGVHRFCGRIVGPGSTSCQCHG